MTTHPQKLLRNQRLPYSVFLALSSVFCIGSLCKTTFAEDHVIDFEMAEIGKPVESWENQGVRFELAHSPKKSTAKGRVTFFPHLGTGNKGIVNAMANEAIPIRISLADRASKVTIKLWGSTTSSAYLEAFDVEGKSLGKQALDHVPVRKTPEEAIPFFELTVEAKNIVSLEVGGSKPGGFLAIEELRWNKQ